MPHGGVRGFRGVASATATTAMLVALGCTPSADHGARTARSDSSAGGAKQPDVISRGQASSADARDSHDPRQSGLAHFQLGELTQAQTKLLAAEARDPGDADVGFALGMIDLIRGRFDYAGEEAARLVAAGSQDVDPYLLLAASARTHEELTAAVKQFADAEQKLAGRAKPTIALAILRLRNGDTSQARRLLQNAVTSDPKSLEAHSVLATFFTTVHDRARAAQESNAAAQISPAGSPSRISLADFYVLIGRRDEAIRVLGEVATQNPRYLPALRRIAELSVTDGRVDAALEAIQPVLERNSSDIDGLFLRGQLRLAKRDAANAMKDFQRILDLDRGVAMARYELALAELEAGDLERAEADFRETLRLQPRFADATVHLADLQIQGGKAEAAIPTLTTLLAAQPSVVPAYNLLASAYLAVGQPARAAETYQQLLKAAPSNTSGHYLLGTALRAAGRRADAVKAFESALVLSPTAYEPIAKLVEMSLAAKRPDEAIARVTKQIAVAPESAPLQNLLGVLYESKGQREQAGSAFRRAIQLDAHLVDAPVQLAKLYVASGRYDQAVATLKTAATANPASATVLSVLGLTYQQKGDIASARQAFEQALTLKPNFVVAANNLAWILAEHGDGARDMQRALQLGQTAMDAAPGDAQVADTYGWILYKHGDFGRAVSVLKPAADKLGDDPTIQYHFGMAAQKTGDIAGARAALSRALASPGSFPAREEARKALADIKK
jgi:tetratricopeptide (TPR) repeat protein